MQGLRELRVIDFSDRIAGAYVTKLLADAYAEVIKVEPRDGDPRSSYATFDGKTVRFHRVEYDVRTTMDKIYATPGLPNYLADRLIVGR